MADVLPKFLAGFTRTIDTAETASLLEDLAAAMTALEGIAAEARRERMIPFGRDPDPAPLVRTVSRLRYDFVILRRAGMAPLPEVFARRLDPPLARLGGDAGAFLRGAAAALAKRRPAPPLDSVDASLKAFDAEVASLRAEGLTRALSTPELERLFALGFGLEQLGRNLSDVGLRVQEFAGGRGGEGRSFASSSR